MSCSLAGAQKIDVKWELARSLTAHIQDSEILTSVCKEALEEIERYKRIYFEDSIKKKVSEKFSKEKTNEFQEAFICGCRDKIFRDFSEEALKEMLEEHVKTGYIRHHEYNAQMQINFLMSKQSLIEDLYQRAVSITTNSLPEIVDALENEGVKFTEE